MNLPDILFQFSSSTASTDLTDGHLVFTAPDAGMTMINSLMICPAFGGTSNVFRIYHTGPDENPASSNMIIFATASTAIKAHSDLSTPVKIIMQPGEKIFCQLHSGDGITVTGYGIVPSVATSSRMQQPIQATEDNTGMQSQTREFIQANPGRGY